MLLSGFLFVGWPSNPIWCSFTRFWCSEIAEGGWGVDLPTQGTSSGWVCWHQLFSVDCSSWMNKSLIVAHTYGIDPLATCRRIITDNKLLSEDEVETLYVNVETIYILETSNMGTYNTRIKVTEYLLNRTHNGCIFECLIKYNQVHFEFAWLKTYMLMPYVFQQDLQDNDDIANINSRSTIVWFYKKIRCFYFVFCFAFLFFQARDKCFPFQARLSLRMDIHYLCIWGNVQSYRRKPGFQMRTQIMKDISNCLVYSYATWF